MEYRREGIMGGDNIPLPPPIWACGCGCKRFSKVNLDGTDTSVSELSRSEMCFQLGNISHYIYVCA